MDDLVRARESMRQLGIEGEVEWTSARVDTAALTFRATRPGRTWNITLSPALNRAVVEQTDINAWGVMRVLHTFTGVRSGDDRNHRDWILTTVWATAMDSVAVGLVAMVLSGLYLWIGLIAKRKLGLIVLLAGTLACGMFVFGLRLIYS
jgi:hypothetical protein